MGGFIKFCSIHRKLELLINNVFPLILKDLNKTEFAMIIKKQKYRQSVFRHKSFSNPCV